MNLCPKCGNSIDSQTGICSHCKTQVEMTEQSLLFNPQMEQANPVNLSGISYKDRRRKYIKWIIYGLISLIILSLSIFGMLKSIVQEQVSAVPAKTAANVWTENEAVPVNPDMANSDDMWALPNAEELGIKIVPRQINEYTGIQPWYPKAGGDLPQLINNPDAQDPTFNALKAFILKDSTNEEEYLPDARHCMDFAESLHNRAEANGVRAAFVGIDFENESWIIMPGHALNAFNTTDKGLVFIDCVGFTKDEVSLCESDRIAYFAIGKEYGTIGISQAKGLDYSSYVEYAEPRKAYRALLFEYEAKCQAFERSYSGKTLTSEEGQKAKAAEAELNSIRQKLEVMYSKMGECVNLPMGIVKTVYIFW